MAVNTKVFELHFPKMDRKVCNIIFLGLFLMILFSSEFSVLNMQKTIISSIHDEKPDFKVEGYTIHAIMYSMFSITVWLAPSVVTVLGPRLSMFTANVGYIMYLLAFSVEEPWALYMAALIVGTSEALLWTAQGNYMVLNSSPATMSRNIGIFWILFSSAELYGNCFLYFKMEGKRYVDHETRQLIIFAMCGIAGTSLLMILFLGKVKKTYPPDMKKDGPLAALKKTWSIFTTKHMLVLCLTFIFIGMQQAFRCGIYSACIGFTLQLGENAKQLVVVSGLCLGIGELCGGIYTTVLSGVAKRYKYGQSLIIGTGLMCQLTAYSIIFVNLPKTAVFGNTLDAPIIPVSKPLALFCSFLLGFADSCCHTQMYSIMAIMFPDNSAQTTAIYKFTKGLFVAGTFYSSSHLNLHTLLSILAPMAIVGNVAFNVVVKNVVKPHHLFVSSRPPKLVNLEVEKH